MRFVGPLVAILSLAPAAFAQTAALRGQVTDETGALIPKATVTLQGPGGIVLAAITDDKGAYVFPALAPA